MHFSPFKELRIIYWDFFLIKWKSWSHQVPNIIAEEIEKIVDRFSKVSASKQIVQMSLDGGEVCAEYHLGDLHIPLRIDDDGRLSVHIEVVDLQPDVSVTIKGKDGQNFPRQIVPSVSLLLSLFK